MVCRYKGTRDTLRDVVYIGDNFVVNAEDENLEGVDFYLLNVKLFIINWKH